MAQLLSDTEIKTQLHDLSDWTQEGKFIKCTRKFQGFPEAVEFVNKLVEPAESAGHHPDLEISYNTVIIRMTSHDAGGLTEKDFNLARTISSL
ncbi:pterin-4-alpha-carbinolamine dehydratase [Halothece sp. PCC 7418]|uniref:4a-hydroxytetrahydrobiopterin dehydratase n=1 Tax=Halothece sp. (strain PCC 7418) TaxID=65093 RepID=UPI0002A063CC|nr:4a-hydroxytetrahydrobiopterin dehydratase [Halothece sp. PCC 7418]AFZ43362.1 pterin-4-alpha-carbinolamine dehydratase [Halothece sp. PCC 7418]